MEKTTINEALSSIVYHFTLYMHLIDIIRYDRLKCSLREDLDDDYKSTKGEDVIPTDEELEQGINVVPVHHINKRIEPKYFVSFTRQINGNLGYSEGNDVRIAFDGDKLNQKYRGHAFNFFCPIDPEWKSTKEKMRMRDKGTHYMSMVENEDRLYSNTKFIEPISPYIKFIDIDFSYHSGTVDSLCKYELGNNFLPYIEDYNIPFRFYLTEKDFTMRSNKNFLTVEDVQKKLQEMNKYESLQHIDSLLERMDRLNKK